MEPVSRHTNDVTGHRHYVRGDTDVLSVTTILGYLDENTKGLEIWKGRNSGYGDDAHHLHLFWYKTLRGTILHYNALSVFDNYFGGDTNSEELRMWGGGEQEALDQLQDATEGTVVIEDDDGTEHAFDAWEVHYSILKDKEIVESVDAYHASSYADETIMDELRRDAAWFMDAFHEVLDLLCITEDDIIAVEQYILNEEYGFGGQADLLYEHDGDVVLADLKTSSSLRQKHRIQATAYARGIDIDVDRIEVWRLHPDTETWTIHSPINATDYHETDYWYSDKWGDFEYADDEAIWDTFLDCIAKANDAEQAHQDAVQSIRDRLTPEHV